MFALALRKHIIVNIWTEPYKEGLYHIYSTLYTLATT